MSHVSVLAARIAAAVIVLSSSAWGASEAVLTDCEAGAQGWITVDAGSLAAHTASATMVTVEASPVAHSGRLGLEIAFHPGRGWANAGLQFSAQALRWSRMAPDELAFWVKGDGSNKEPRVALQAWDDDLATPVMFELPLPLSSTEWREVVIPLQRFQAANPSYRLRIPSLISFQIDGSGEIGPAKLWIDDVRLRNARGEGGPFAEGPLDAAIASKPPVGALPRFGNWLWPGRNAEALPKCLALGIQFSSNDEMLLFQQKMWLSGIATSYSVGRPTGAELISGLGFTSEDMDQDSHGERTGEGVQGAVFSPAVAERFYDYVRMRIRPLSDAPWVASFVLSSPISMYGEVHYAASASGRYAVFSRPAKESFRRWLKTAYKGSLRALSTAWGEDIRSWDEIVPPDGQEAAPGGIDTRRKWSDFIHWYNWWLDEVTWKSLQAARAETRKPIAAMIGGPKVGYSQGVALGNVGRVVKMLGKVKPSFFSDTDSQTLFSTQYTSAACEQYGVDLMVEHVGPPHLQPFHQYNTILNALRSGAGHVHLAHLGEGFDPSHFFSRIWTDLSPLVSRYHTKHVRSDAAIFHSYVTSWYRPDRSNADAVGLYDDTNTLWTPSSGRPSWGRALAAPDVLDDTMVEDGALDGRKLLVIPNSSMTVTTRKAMEAIRRWVKAGGVLIGFGPGCLAYAVESDRSLRPTPGLAGLVPSDALNDCASGRVEYAVGSGRVVWYSTPADVSLKGSSGKPFVVAVMSDLYQEAERAGVRRWCEAYPRFEANPIYCGKDLNTGRHIFTLDLTKRAQNDLSYPQFLADCVVGLRFDASLTGEAELVAMTDSFVKCDGGYAEFNAAKRTLVVRFRLPGRLRLAFGEARGER